MANIRRLQSVDEGRRSVLLIAAAILSARKLAQYEWGSEFRPRCARSQMRFAGLRSYCERSTSGGQAKSNCSRGNNTGQ
jgi:hypothetical protein